MSILSSIGGFFKAGGSKATELIDNLGQFTQRLQSILDKWESIKADWQGLFEPQEVDHALNSKVIPIANAQDVLENLRINALKDRALQLYDDIKGIINLALHPVGGSSEADQAILSGAQAYSGKPGAGAGQFHAASLINSILNFEDRVLELEDKILEVLKLLDIIKDMRDQIESGALQQRNSVVSVDGVRRRVHSSVSNGETGTQETI